MTHFTPRTHPSFIDALTPEQREGYLSALDLADKAQGQALDLFQKMDLWRESHQGYFAEPKETPPDESPAGNGRLLLSEPAARCYKACRPLFSELERVHPEYGVMGWDGYYPTAVEAVHSFAVRTMNQICLQIDPAWANKSAAIDTTPSPVRSRGSFKNC